VLHIHYSLSKLTVRNTSQKHCNINFFQYFLLFLQLASLLDLALTAMASAVSVRKTYGPIILRAWQSKWAVQVVLQEHNGKAREVLLKGRAQYS
jgi:hypothetical protein